MLINTSSPRVYYKLTVRPPGAHWTRDIMHNIVYLYNTLIWFMYGTGILNSRKYAKKTKTHL